MLKTTNLATGLYWSSFWDKSLSWPGRSTSCKRL